MKLENKHKLKYLGYTALLILICVFCFYVPLTLFAKNSIDFSPQLPFDDKIILSISIGAFFAITIFILGARFLYKKYKKESEKS